MGDAFSSSVLAHRLSKMRADPTLWSGALGREVMAEASRRFQRLAIACGAEKEDGAAFAWQFWTQELSDEQLRSHTDDLWQYTGGVVRRHLLREKVSQNHLTSSRVAVAGMDVPVRYHSADMLAGIAAKVSALSEHSAPAAMAQGRRQGLATVRQILVVAGLTPMQRELVLSELAQLADSTRSLRAALERAGDSPVSALSAERWKALLEIVLGTPKGKPGVPHLVGSGHPSPFTEPHLKKPLSVFLGSPALFAAGV